MKHYYLLKNGVRVKKYLTWNGVYKACAARYRIDGPDTWAVETVEVEK